MKSYIKLEKTTNGYAVNGCQGCSLSNKCKTLRAMIDNNIMSFNCAEFEPKYEKCTTCGKSKNNINRWGCFNDSGNCDECTDNEHGFWCVNVIQCRECYDKMCKMINSYDNEQPCT